MAKIDWVFTNQSASLNFTSLVTNFSYTHGRASNLSDYSGGYASITVDNESAQAAAYFLKWGQQIKIQCGGTDQFVGWIGAIDYTDLGNTGAGSTATITVNDQMYFAGQELAANQVLTSEEYQIQEMNFLLTKGGILQSDFTKACRGSLDYSGSYATRINQIISSDRGKFFFIPNGYYEYTPLNKMATRLDSTYRFGREPSATTIAYSSFNRFAAGSNQNFVNQAAVTPESLATQTGKSSTSIYFFGAMGIDIATLNTTVSVGKNLANWVAHTMDNPDELSFSISILDIAQTDTTKLVSFLTDEKIVQLEYSPPGESSRIMWVTAEQITVTGDYQQTRVDIIFSPMTFYEAFTLDSPVLGILGGTGVTYNANITYNEPEILYNDASASAGSRLGF
jgi:hypothetical protein